MPFVRYECGMLYSDVIMSVMGSQITCLTIVYSTVYSGGDQRKYQSSASPAFVWGIHWWPVNSPHKWPVTRKMFPFDDVIMWYKYKEIVRLKFRWWNWLSTTLEQSSLTLIGLPWRQIGTGPSTTTMEPNGNIFRFTGHLCGEFTGHRWLPRTKASDAELWSFLWSASE